jgi:hypothetical protein
LAPKATKVEDTDTLFFFINEFFMHHSYPLRRQQQQHLPTLQDLPAPKRATLDGDDTGKKLSLTILLIRLEL